MTPTAPLTNQLAQLAWRKSSRSANNTGQCVEVAGLVSGESYMVLRDSKMSQITDYPVLVTTSREWAGLLRSIRDEGGCLFRLAPLANQSFSVSQNIVNVVA